jgi:hypothetical protein
MMGVCKEGRTEVFDFWGWESWGRPPFVNGNRGVGLELDLDLGVTFLDLVLWKRRKG